MAKAKFPQSVELVPFIGPKQYAIKLNLVPRGDAKRTFICEVVLDSIPAPGDMIQGTYRVVRCWCHDVRKSADEGENMEFWEDVEAVE